MEKKRFFSRFFIILIFISALAYYKNPDIFTDLYDKIDFNLLKYTASENDNNKNYTNADFYKRSLDKKEQQIYDIIYKNAVIHNEEDFIIPEIKISKLSNIYHKMLYDHEEIYYINGITYTTEDNENTTILNITYKCDKKTKEKYEKQLEIILDDILDEMENLSTYEKVIYAHDYIIQNTMYNEDAENNQNILSVFLGNKSVCAGYSRAYQYILKRSGVYCIFIPGVSIQMGERCPHAWNLVKLDDGKYYYVDTTFDETEILPNEDVLRYNYLNITTEQLLHDHDFEENMPELPIADSTRYNYFNMNNLYFEKYDNNTKYIITNSIIEAIEKKDANVFFKFANIEDLYKFEEDYHKDDHNFIISLGATYFNDSETFITNFASEFDNCTNVATIFLFYE